MVCDWSQADASRTIRCSVPLTQVPKRRALIANSPAVQSRTRCPTSNLACPSVSIPADIYPTDLLRSNFLPRSQTATFPPF